VSVYPHLGGRLKKSVDQALAHSGRQREPLLPAARAKEKREERLGLLENGVKKKVELGRLRPEGYGKIFLITRSIPKSNHSSSTVTQSCVVDSWVATLSKFYAFVDWPIRFRASKVWWRGASISETTSRCHGIICASGQLHGASHVPTKAPDGAACSPAASFAGCYMQLQVSSA
jgi:hypothetical protein